MRQLAWLVLVSVAILAGCDGTTQDEEATASTLSAATTTASTVAQTTTTTTTEATLPTTTTPINFENGIAEIDFRDDIGIGGLHPVGGSGPVTGWVSTESPAPVTVGIDGNGDQLVKIGDSTSIASEQGSWLATGKVHLDPGINEVPIIVEGITPPLSISVPITYLPGAAVQFAVVVDADDDSITLDYGYYYWDGSFPSIGDHDPGVLETVQVAPDAYVILSDELIVEYWWFLEQRQTATDHDEIGWYPSSEYTYYWATVHEGQLVELWRIPFG